MKKWLFKHFGDGQIFIWIFRALAFLYFIAIALIIWIAIHFVTKYW